MNTSTATEIRPEASAATEQERSASDMRWAADKMESLDALVAVLARSGHGVVMLTGNAGVGKTTVAAAVAVILARSGHAVQLVLTAPTDELATSLAGNVERLTLVKIDPVAETAAYRADVLRVQGGALSQAGRAMLEEDLLSRCTVEMAMFRAFARETEVGTEGFVVFDSAPTAHTLLLLDANASYQREMERQEQTAQPADVVRLLARLRDPAFARVVVVALPSESQVADTAGVQEDLRRAHVEPFAWIFDQTRLNGTDGNPGMREQESEEHRTLCAAVDGHTSRTAWVPRLAHSPVGPEELMRLGAIKREADAQ